jgi:hypothetical protein
MINIYGIQSSEPFQMVFDSIMFTNVSFATKGYLFSLKQHLVSQVVISNSYFTNIQKGSILVEANDKQLISQPTQVKITNSVFDNINQEYTSLLQINEGGRLEIQNSTFTNVYWYEEAPVIFAGFQKAQVTITDSAFRNNAAVQGGLFIIESESSIKWTNCTMENNFALVDAILQTQNNGYFEFYNSTLAKNYAIVTPIGEVFDGSIASIISNCSINSNIAIEKSQLISELTTSWTILCFLSQNFKEFVLSNQNLIPLSSSNLLMQIISTPLEIVAETKISEQSTLFNI